MAQFRKMVESSKLDLVATTLAKFVGVLEQREGGREAFKKARAGATLKAKEEALAKKREADKLLRDLDDLE